MYANFSGWLWVLGSGYVIPAELGLAIAPDGREVGGPHGPTHHTIYPTQAMSFDIFVQRVMSLPWFFTYIKKK